MPSNGTGLRARKLDCAVTNFLHRLREDNDLPAYDTVRGLFWEGAPIYEGAGVREFNHIQICVRDLSCILGYFRPIQLPTNSERRSAFSPQFSHGFDNRIPVFGAFHPGFDPLNLLSMIYLVKRKMALLCGHLQILFNEIQMFAIKKPQVFSLTGRLQPQPQSQTLRLLRRVGRSFDVCFHGIAAKTCWHRMAHVPQPPPTARQPNLRRLPLLLVIATRTIERDDGWIIAFS